MAFARNEGKLKKQQPNFFKVAIRFRLNHPWPKALIYSLSTLMDRVVLNKTDHYLAFPSKKHTF